MRTLLAGLELVNLIEASVAEQNAIAGFDQVFLADPALVALFQEKIRRMDDVHGNSFLKKRGHQQKSQRPLIRLKSFQKSES